MQTAPVDAFHWFSARIVMSLINKTESIEKDTDPRVSNFGSKHCSEPGDSESSVGLRESSKHETSRSVSRLSYTGFPPSGLEQEISKKMYKAILFMPLLSESFVKKFS